MTPAANEAAPDSIVGNEAPPAPLPAAPAHTDEKSDGVRVCTRCGIVWSAKRKPCRGVLPAVVTR